MKSELEGKKAWGGILPESTDENLKVERHIRYICLIGFPKGQNRMSGSEQHAKQ